MVFSSPIFRNFMINVNIILLIIAFICLLLAALNIPSNRVSLGWLGLSFWVLSLLIR